jgi:hypothetical protein
VDLLRDREHCGACDIKCGADRQCVSGACEVVCPMGRTLCGDACVDTKSDPAHCGSCEKACQKGGCKAGVCEKEAQG